MIICVYIFLPLIKNIMSFKCILWTNYGKRPSLPNLPQSWINLTVYHVPSFSLSKLIWNGPANFLSSNLPKKASELVSIQLMDAISEERAKKPTFSILLMILSVLKYKKPSLLYCTRRNRSDKLLMPPSTFLIHFVFVHLYAIKKNLSIYNEMQLLGCQAIFCSAFRFPLGR